MTWRGSTSTTAPVVVLGEARRCVHPRVGGDHRHAAEDPRQDDRNPGPEVRPRLEPTPTEDVDRDEDRFGEEEQPFERERHAERLAPLAHEPRPQQAELETEHGAGHRAHRERHGHVLRPALGQHQRIPVAVLDRSVVGDQRHGGPRHAQRHQNDVEHQGERHLRSGPRHGIHGGGKCGHAVDCRDSLDHSIPPEHALDDTWIVTRGARDGHHPSWVMRMH